MSANEKPSDFTGSAQKAFRDPRLQAALTKLQSEFRHDRSAMRGRLPEFDKLCEQARVIKDHALDHLDSYLEQFETNVRNNGGTVHWCADAESACRTILEICNYAKTKKIAKGKSMVSEEIGLNDFLHKNGIRPVETDLGEYILQLRKERPSHVVMPAIHLDANQIGAVFRDEHVDLPSARDLNDPDRLLAEARAMLRQEFLTADVGITGANFLVAETGSIVLVTNEGNGDLVHTLPNTHIVLAGIEKVVPLLADAFALVRVLARSATTQEITSYTSVISGPRRSDEIDGPQSFHVVLVDNGRSTMLGNEFSDVLRCIRCGACQSLCPVYGAVGGHAYGAVYAGPIGAVLTPNLIGVKQAKPLPEASSFCGKCQDVCPVGIPLPNLMRRWRAKIFDDNTIPSAGRRWIKIWAYVASRPNIYRALQRIGVLAISLLGRRSGKLRRLPLASAWTTTRDLPAPQGGTFLTQWRHEAGKRMGS